VSARKTAAICDWMDLLAGSAERISAAPSPARTFGVEMNISPLKRQCLTNAQTGSRKQGGGILPPLDTTPNRLTGLCIPTAKVTPLPPYGPHTHPSSRFKAG